MTNSTYTSSAPSPLWQYWRGLSGWNFYFLVKFGLLWQADLISTLCLTWCLRHSC
ncbi:hypothetical protein ACVXG7_30640 [Enterobacter hormaechei]